MRFNTLIKLTSFLSVASVAYCNRMTYYGLNNNRPSVSAPPSCGIDGVDLKTEYYIALNKDQFIPTQVRADNPNTATVCNKCVKITYKNKWVVGKIIDKCPGCPYGGLDVSPTLFKTLENLDAGVIDMKWDYTDCSLLGKSGTCSGGNCSSSSSPSSPSSPSSSSSSSSSKKEESHKPEVKKTTRKASTSRRTTIRTVAKPTTVGKSNPISRPTYNISKKPVTSKKLNNSKTINQGNSRVNVGITKTLPKNTKVPSTKVVATPVLAPINKQENTVNRTSANTSPVETVSTQKTGPVVDNIANEKESGTNYALPITGAVVGAGAAGIALLYAKRNPNNVRNLKEKFPEAFSNIKRSISRGSTQLRRTLSNSSLALKRSLSKKGTDSYESYNNPQDPSGPHIRTKKEYRASLDAHYPIQLHDPPVSQTYQPTSSTHHGYNSMENAQPNYHLQHFNANGDSNMRVDFHDSYYY